MANKMTKRPTLDLKPITIGSSLQIKGYTALDKQVNQVVDKYKGFIGTEKQCRQVKRTFNKARRKFNQLRRDKARPKRQQLKEFKGWIDNITDKLGVVPKAMDKQLAIYKQRDQKRILKRFQPTWDKLCQVHHLPRSATPKDIVAKASYTKKARIDILAGCAATLDQERAYKNARVVNGKAVDITVNGEIKPIPHAMVQHMTVIGTPLQMTNLHEFLKKNNIKVIKK